MKLVQAMGWVFHFHFYYIIIFFLFLIFYYEYRKKVMARPQIGRRGFKD